MFARSRASVVLALACATAASVALSGCSSSGKASNSASHSVAGSSSTASSAAGAGSPAALVPASVKSKGTLLIAMDASYPPMEFFKPGTKGPIIGMDADLGKALGQVLGLKVSEKNVTFDAIIPGLVDGKYDLGISGFGDTKKREQSVDFVTYLDAGESFYVKSDSTKTFDSLASLCGAKVAVENGTTEQSDAQSQSKKCTAAGKPAVQVLQFSDQTSANLAVENGRADVGFSDTPPVAYIVQQSNGQFKTSGPSFGAIPFGIALPKGNGMAAAVLAAMKVLIANGQYATILKNWNMSASAIKTPAINGAIN